MPARMHALPGRGDPDPQPLRAHHDEGRQLRDDLASFGTPRPLVVVTGGDPFERPDLPELVAHGTRIGLSVALPPSVTARLTRAGLVELHEAGAKAVSLSLDGATAQTHDSVHRVDGVFAATVDAARTVLDVGFRLQITRPSAEATCTSCPGSCRRSSTWARRCRACSSSSRPAVAPSWSRSPPARKRKSCTGCTTSQRTSRSRPPRHLTTGESPSSAPESRRSTRCSPSGRYAPGCAATLRTSSPGARPGHANRGHRSTSMRAAASPSPV